MPEKKTQEKKNIYLICGDEEYLKESRLAELLKQYPGEGSINYNAYDGRNMDMTEVISTAFTMPFMDEYRTVLIRDTGLLKAGKKKAASDGVGPESGDGDEGASSDNASAAEADGAADETSGSGAGASAKRRAAGGEGGGAGSELEELIEGLPQSTALILYENDVNAAGRLFKLIKKCGEVYSLKKAEQKGKSWKETENDRSRIRKWVSDYIRDNGRRIDSRDLEYFLQLTGYDMLNISTELEKLISYTYERAQGSILRKEDIDAIVSKNIQDRVFDMIGFKLGGNKARAVALLEDMLSIKVAPMKILYLLARQFDQVYKIKELASRGAGDKEIAERMHLNDWQLRKLKEQSSGLSLRGAKKYVELCISMEQRIKEGDMPERTGIEIILST